MQSPRFTQNNEGFTCIACHQRVDPHPSSSRDHCNHCLVGLHVDIHPGDRLNDCRGALEPIGLRVKNDKRQIVHRCNNCGEQVFNLAAPDDNPDLLFELTNMPW